MGPLGPTPASLTRKEELSQDISRLRESSGEPSGYIPRSNTRPRGPTPCGARPRRPSCGEVTGRAFLGCSLVCPLGRVWSREPLWLQGPHSCLNGTSWEGPGTRGEEQAPRGPLSSQRVFPAPDAGSRQAPRGGPVPASAGVPGAPPASASHCRRLLLSLSLRLPLPFSSHWEPLTLGLGPTPARDELISRPLTWLPPPSFTPSEVTFRGAGRTHLLGATPQSAARGARQGHRAGGGREGSVGQEEPAVPSLSRGVGPSDLHRGI